jgi:hypothetical protein
MILSKEQREGIFKMLGWLDTYEGEIRLSSDRVREKEIVKDQLLKVLLLDEYDGKDKELLNSLRKIYLDSYSASSL